MGEVQQIRQPEESWVNAQTVAKHLGCSSDHVRVLVRRGRIPAKNIGMGKRPFWVFRISEVDAAVKAVAS
jgi:excisionase family DNA binding protein